MLVTKPGTILLADDSEDDILLVSHAFEQAGIANPLAVVRDGEEAIAYLEGKGQYGDRALYPLPVLMLLDLKMPRTDGFQVLRWIRLHAHFKALPVIVLTTSSLTTEVNLAYHLDASPFL